MVTAAGRGERARKTTSKAPFAPTNKLSEDEIRLLAYRLYQRRCESGTDGDAVTERGRLRRAGAGWLQGDVVAVGMTDMALAPGVGGPTGCRSALAAPRHHERAEDGLVVTRSTPPRRRVAGQLAGACRWRS